MTDITDMYLYIIIGAAAILLIYGAYYGVSKYLEKQSLNIQEIKSILETHGTLHEEGLYLSYDYQGLTYSVIMIKVQKYAKFQFNSRTIWEKKIGQKKFYTDQTIFSKMPNRKIVIIYPNEGPFTYHYDESDVRFTKPNERIWDMHVIPFNELDTVLKEGL
ncbi:hypothetical protein [Acholeplasma laidlawii]|jgi:hypothetical protein|uniref:Uncharacterized protein n=2 Tax=Acholeplasma laidlawii TaxID=2148 RepID=A0A553IHM7_ACHLA|nr:hypothetical protein [Acholeplasma laidlawii]ABX81468.1 hypothetical surface-anchored protein [Acholeplasma laidlawii PG-8A]NWH09958.1 hypothetical protein [Acholeplasma laidlawii]NWH11348.1 hypothetical protein [Acholeplasma laidlawii]NWH13242.1 hypothetical protein [Acholeplasma laidlawii]NWH15125.1 hypothetical protein [Acholeplasma laidlawii]